MTSGGMPVPRKLWENANPEASYMAKFMQRVNKKRGLNLNVIENLLIEEFLMCCEKGCLTAILS